MAKGAHIHTPEDGRGNRIVRVDGHVIPYAFFADTKRGIVRAALLPLRTDKHGKRVLCHTIRGCVEVAPVESAS
jgi:hypothetical protein